MVFQIKPTRKKKAGNASAGMYLRKPGKYGYEKPSKNISLIAPSPAARAPPAKTARLPVMANSESPKSEHRSQNIANAVKNAAIAPPIVIIHGADIPRTRAGRARVYGAANCIEKRDSGCGVVSLSSRPV